MAEPEKTKLKIGDAVNVLDENGVEGFIESFEKVKGEDCAKINIYKAPDFRKRLFQSEYKLDFPVKNLEKVKDPGFFIFLRYNEEDSGHIGPFKASLDRALRARGVKDFKICDKVYKQGIYYQGDEYDCRGVNMFFMDDPKGYLARTVAGPAFNLDIIDFKQADFFKMASPKFLDRWFDMLNKEINTGKVKDFLYNRPVEGLEMIEKLKKEGANIAFFTECWRYNPFHREECFDIAKELVSKFGDEGYKYVAWLTKIKLSMHELNEQQIFDTVYKIYKNLGDLENIKKEDIRSIVDYIDELTANKNMTEEEKKKDIKDITDYYRASKKEKQ